MNTPKISPWQEFSPSNKVVFLIYYFCVCILPILALFLLVNISVLSEGLFAFIFYGVLIFAIVTFTSLEASNIKPLLSRPLRLFFPIFIQVCFLVYSFSLDVEKGKNSIIIFVLSEFVGVLLALTIIFISYIYKKRLSPKEHVGDKFIKVFFGLFITMFFWMPVVLFGYVYISGVMFSQSGIPLYVGIAQFLTGVIAEVISQKEIMKSDV